MKIKIVFVFCCTFLFQNTFANPGVESGALFVGSVAGSAIGISSLHRSRMSSKDVQAFADVNIGQAIDLGMKCNVITYMKLMKQHRHLYFALIFHNTSNENRVYKLDKTTVVLDNKITLRNFHGALTNNNVVLKSQRYMVDAFRIDNPNDLKNVKQLVVNLDIAKESGGSCSQTLTLNKNPHFNSDKDLKDMGTFLDMSFDFGGLIASSGEVKDFVGNGGSYLDLSIDFFPSAHHGFNFNFHSKRYKGKFDKLKAEVTHIDPDYLILNGFGLGYIYRHHFNKDNKLQFYLNYTFGEIREINDDDRDDIGKINQLQSKLVYNRVLNRIQNGPSVGNEYGVGIGISYSKNMKFKLNKGDEDYSGTDSSLFFRLFMGL